MEKISRLKRLLIQCGLDGYIIPKNDEFFGEYTEENRDKLKYISEFSGSYGLALILKNKNYLFVDGRYSLQAKIQSGKFFKVVVIPQKIPSNILGKRKLKIGYDPRLHTTNNLRIFFKRTECKLFPVQQNLVDKIWSKKNKSIVKKFYVLPKNAVDQNYNYKINKLINILKSKKIDLHFVTASENIAWLLNIRGQDSNFSPIPNSYLTLSIDGKINLFCNLKKIDKIFIKKLRNIKIINIEDISLFLSKLKNKKILIDSSSCSVHFENILTRKNKLVQFLDPIYSLKSIKTNKEIKNIIKSHMYDGAALTKFLIWLKKNYIKLSINEISAQKKLLRFRKKNKNFKFSSFPSISASGPNGAIIHYRATKKTNRKLKRGDIYLIDSGGQYNFGTTDVTRTISLDNKDQKIKNIFTRVLKGHIAVASLKLRNNTRGAQIDNLARKFLRNIKLDYAHGTGHGVGYFLNVHEGPQALSKKNTEKLRDGMILSNEPGYYKNGKFGIRIENLVRIKKFKNIKIFDNLTMAPIDKSLINKDILKKDEINWLNKYHKKVFMNLKKFMNKIELEELKRSCSKI